MAEDQQKVTEGQLMAGAVAVLRQSEGHQAAGSEGEGGAGCTKRILPPMVPPSRPQSGEVYHWKRYCVNGGLRGVVAVSPPPF